MFTDTHAHLTFPDYEKDIKDVLARARAAGVETIINIGSGNGLEDNVRSLELTKLDKNVYSTVGIHPHDAGKMNNVAEPFRVPQFNGRLKPSATEFLMNLADDPKVVAVGEIGLDYHYIAKEAKGDFEKAKAAQIECFKKMLALASEKKLPVIIHDREAHADTIFTIQHNQGNDWGGVMHCFSGDNELAREVLDLGFYISVTGAVTFKKKADILQDVVRYVPIERLLIETDSPFIAPEPYRGKRNEPAYVVEVAKKIAELKNLSLEDVGRITTINAQRLFHLPGEIPEGRIAYAIRSSLYLNITNRCNLACTFCPKQSGSYEVKGHNLKLSHEPDVEEVFKAIGEPKGFKEVVFCGYGEPTMRLEVVKAIATRLKQLGARIRLDTDGLANLSHNRDVLPELKGLIDEVSVSINAPDAASYVRLCPSKFGEKAFAAACEFIREAKKYIPEVSATAVTCPEVDIAACKKLVEKELGVKFRPRPYQDLG